MFPYGSHFRPSFPVTRSDLAATLVLAGRAPQYLPGHPTYRDVTNPSLMIFVESVQAAPGGPYFAGVSPGGSFAPNGVADRLTAAIALVRAAGLRGEAEARAGAALNLADAASIPPDWAGYVAVALERGLLRTRGANFEPQAALTRAELAHAMAAMIGF